MSTGNTTGYDPFSLAPPAQWHDHDARGHMVQFYSEDATLLESISRSIGTALGAGDAAVVIASKVHRDGLSRLLKERGFDVASAIRRGRYVVLDAAETLSKFMRDGWPDAARFAALAGGICEQAKAASEGDPPRVAVFGEMVALLWAEGKPEAAIRLEQLWNDLAQKHSFALRCAYPITAFNRDEYDEPFLRICAGHTAVIPGESYTTLLTEEERLRGITRLQQKAQALEAARTEREEAQNSLRGKQAELADFLENAVEGVQQVGADRKILWANKSLLNLLGYSPEEYVGHPLMDFYADQKIHDEYWRKVMQEEDICDYPAELRCKDGSLKHVLISSNGLWEKGKFVRTRCFVRDVSEQRRAEQALRESEANLRLAKDNLESLVEQRTVALRHLSARVLALQDAERRRIARELHDSLGQYLVGLKLNIDMLRESPTQLELWTQSAELMDRCISEVRTLSYLLHPPMIDDVGLASSARWLVEGLSKRSGIQVNLDAPRELPRLPAEIELVLFRALQEALTNVHRHSGASAAEVVIRREAEQMVLEVRDNGRGIERELLSRFDQTGAGMGVGLSGMRERVCELGGRIKLEADHNGTSLRIALPLAPANPAII